MEITGMDRFKNRFRLESLHFVPGVLFLVCTGCTQTTYRDYWRDAQLAMIRGDYYAARTFLDECERRRPRRVENLHDQGVCCMMISRDKFTQMNHAAAMRELDHGLAYFTSAIDDVPGHQASSEGKNRTLELKGQYEAALEQAEWTLKFVGPSARQYLFLARELEERGDKDGALLRYRQAISAEPGNPEPYSAMARFLLRERDEPGAIQHLREAYRLNPRDAWVAEQLTIRGVLPVVQTGRATAP